MMVTGWKSVYFSQNVVFPPTTLPNPIFNTVTGWRVVYFSQNVVFPPTNFPNPIFNTVTGWRAVYFSQKIVFPPSNFSFECRACLTKPNRASVLGRVNNRG